MTSPRRQLAGGSACPTCCIVGGHFRSIPVLGKRSQAAPQIGGLRLVDPSPRQTEPGGAADRRPETRRSPVHEDPPAPLDEPTSRPRANLRPPTATPIAQPSRCGRSLRPTSPYTSVSRAARRLVQGLIRAIRLRLPIPRGREAPRPQSPDLGGLAGPPAIPPSVLRRPACLQKQQRIAALRQRARLPVKQMRLPQPAPQRTPARNVAQMQNPLRDSRRR